MEGKTLLHYWLIIYRRRWVVLIVAVVSALTAAAISLTMKPVYEAQASFYVPASSSSVSYLSTESTDKLAREVKVPYPKEEPQAPYIGMLKSKTMATLVQKEFPHKSFMKYFLFDIDYELTDEFLIKIYSRDSDPAKAADIANAYVRHLNDMLQASSGNNLQGDIALMDKQAVDLKKQLTDAQDALKDFEKKSNFASLDEEIKNLTIQKVAFQSQLETNRVQLQENEEKTKGTTEQLKKEKGLYAKSDFSLTNNVIDHLQEKLSDISAQITASGAELTEAHPDMVALKKRYADTEESLKKEVQRLVSSQIKPNDTFFEQLRQNLVNDLIEKNRLTAQNRGYAEAVGRVSKQIEKYPALKTEWDRLSEDVDRYKKMYEQIRINGDEAGMQNARQMQFVVQVDTARPPDRPSFPIMWLNVLVGLIFGVIAGVLCAFFLNYIEATRKYRMTKLIGAVTARERE